MSLLETVGGHYQERGKVLLDPEIQDPNDAFYRLTADPSVAIHVHTRPGYAADEINVQVRKVDYYALRRLFRQDDKNHLEVPGTSLTTPSGNTHTEIVATPQNIERLLERLCPELSG